MNTRSIPRGGGRSVKEGLRCTTVTREWCSSSIIRLEMIMSFSSLRKDVEEGMVSRLLETIFQLHTEEYFHRFYKEKCYYCPFLLRIIKYKTKSTRHKRVTEASGAKDKQSDSNSRSDSGTKRSSAKG